MDADYDDDVAEGRTRRIKGRGADKDDRYAGSSGVFEGLPHESGDGGPARSIEGFVIIVSGVQEEAQEDDVFDAFSEFGDIKNLHLNLDRRTGFVKGYSFIEYEKKREAEAAIKNMNAAELLGQTLSVDWAFLKPGGQKRGR